MVDTDKGPSRTADDYFWTSQESPEGMTSYLWLKVHQGWYCYHHRQTGTFRRDNCSNRRKLPITSWRNSRNEKPCSVP